MPSQSKTKPLNPFEQDLNDTKQTQDDLLNIVVDTTSPKEIAIQNSKVSNVLGAINRTSRNILIGSSATILVNNEILKNLSVNPDEIIASGQRVDWNLLLNPFNAIVVYSTANKMFTRLTTQKLSYFPAYLNELGHGNKLIGSMKLTGKFAVAFGAATSFHFVMGFVHDKAINGNIFEDNSAGLLAITFLIGNPLLRELLYGLIGKVLFDTTCKLFELCKTYHVDDKKLQQEHIAENTGIFTFRNLAQKAQDMTLAIAVTEATRATFIFYGLGPFANNIFSCVYSFAASEALKYSSPEIKSKATAEQAPLLSQDIVFSDHDIEIEPKSTACDKVRAFNKASISTMFSMAVVVAGAMTIDAVRSAIDPEFQKKQAPLYQRIGTYVLIISAGNLASNVAGKAFDAIAARCKARLFSHNTAPINHYPAAKTSENKLWKKS